MVEYLRSHWIFGIGFLAQSFFGARIVIQWVASERKGQVSSPGLFWKLSLAGSTIFLIYGILRLDIVIALGQCISHSIYIRNLQLKSDWGRFPRMLRVALLLIPVMSAAWAIKSLFDDNVGQTIMQNWSPLIQFYSLLKG